jgi:hypothetical protein
MPESVLLAGELAEEELQELRRKFHPHHDYLNLIVPSVWFLVGTCFVEFYFYHARHLKLSLARLQEIEPFAASASTSLQFFLALSLFICGFTCIYVIGQIINGASALILDRTIVKKLLKYPFELYERRLHTPASEVDDRQLFKALVLESSYLVFCLNLMPLIFLELVASLFALRSTDFRYWLQTHPVSIMLLLVCLLYMHFGPPSLRKPYRSGDSLRATNHYKEFALLHASLLLILFVLEFILMIGTGGAVAILLLPATNLVIGVSERFTLSHGTQSAYVTRFFFYAKACFSNSIYFAAKLTGYGDIPSQEIIATVRRGIGKDYDARDFFWMTYLTVQNRGLGSSQTVYHFLAMYGMVRNLCNATSLILMTDRVL